MPAPTSIPLSDIRIVLLEGVHPRAADFLRRAGYTVSENKGALSGAALEAAIADAHMVGIRSKTQLTDAVLSSPAAKRLWAIGCYCIGTNQVDLAAASARGIAVFNAPFSNTRSVAEKTIAEIICLERRLFEKSMAMHQGQWDKSAAGAHEVRGRTLGIVGYGRIGSQLSVLAESLGMRVIYFDAADRLPMGNARPVRTLEELLREADVVTLHVPATAHTDRLIGKAQLAMMKPGSALINNARGSVVDVHALADALRSGHLIGAAIDVFPEEPEASTAPFDAPLRGIPSVILTPHVGGSTEEAQAAIADEVSVKLVKVMNNGSTATSVNMPEVELPMLHTGQHRILHYHRNVPGVLSKMHKIIAELGVNISAEYLQSGPKHSYVILDVDPAHGEELKDRLRDEVDETIRVRSIW
jgi:D-3-phosphoglycerate dehydrogenase